jgi:hypothetical protein
MQGADIQICHVYVFVLFLLPDSHMWFSQKQIYARHLRYEKQSTLLCGIANIQTFKIKAFCTDEINKK